MAVLGRGPDRRNSETWAEDGAVFDPVRPQIEPGGFEDEFRATRAALGKSAEESSVFIFTLGLTEWWENARTGLAPERLAGPLTPTCTGSGP